MSCLKRDLELGYGDTLAISAVRRLRQEDMKLEPAVASW